METLGKDSYEYEKQHHEVLYIYNDINNHHNEEAHLFWYSDKKQHFDQSKKETQNIEYTTSVWNLIFKNVHAVRYKSHDNAYDFEYVPKVRQIGLFLFHELAEFIGKEEELDDLTNGFATIEHEILYSVITSMYFINNLHVRVGILWWLHFDCWNEGYV